MKTFHFKFLCVVIITFYSPPGFAQAGDLDSTFGINGIVTTAIDSLNTVEANAVALQSDGKIVVAGQSWNSYNDYNFALARYYANGTLDSSFGTNGRVLTSIGLWFDVANSVVIQPDEKIVAVGYSYLSFGADFTMARYNSNGSLDSSFGTEGIVISDMGSEYDWANSAAIQSDGKIVVAGSEGSSNDRDFVLARYNTDGSLDLSFGLNGKAYATFSSGNNEAKSIALQADGKIVVAGYLISGSGNFALVRFNTDGTRDSDFGSDGKVTTAVDGKSIEANSVTIQADGRIVATGSLFNGSTNEFALIRYKTDGTLDNTFGIEGKIFTNLGPVYSSAEANAVAIQPDGKIVAAGSYSINGFSDFASVRYTANGTIDNSFGSDGKVITAISQFQDAAYSMVIQSDGKIVLAGFGFIDYGLPGGFALIRYLSGLNIGIANFSFPKSSPLIYPNPIQQTEEFKYTLTQEESLTLSLYDMNGKLMKNFFTNETRTIDEHHEELNFGNLDAGNYLLTLSNGTQQVSVKIVKQ